MSANKGTVRREIVVVEWRSRDLSMGVEFICGSDFEGVFSTGQKRHHEFPGMKSFVREICEVACPVSPTRHSNPGTWQPLRQVWRGKNTFPITARKFRIFFFKKVSVSENKDDTKDYIKFNSRVFRNSSKRGLVIILDIYKGINNN